MFNVQNENYTPFWTFFIIIKYIKYNSGIFAIHTKSLLTWLMVWMYCLMGWNKHIYLDFQVANNTNDVITTMQFCHLIVNFY